MPAVAAPPRRRVSVAILLLAVAGLWSLGWVLAAHEAGVAMDRWMQVDAARGRQWTCPGRHIDGYPFVVAVRCTQPTFAGEIAGHPASGHVEEVRASLGLLHPRTLHLTLRGPFYLRGLDDSFDLVSSWEDMTLAIKGPGAPSGSLTATRLAVTLATPDMANLNLRAGHLTGAASPTGAAGADAAFTLAAEGVVLPTVDGLPELAGEGDASAQGVLAEAALLTAPTVRRLEAWRAAGGHLRLDALTVRQGPFKGRASGTLGLDAAHRAAGRLDTSLTGFEPLAKRLGIPLAGVQIGSFLTNLLGGGGAPAGGRDPHAIALPLLLADGRLAVGPIETSLRLDPLY